MNEEKVTVERRWKIDKMRNCNALLGSHYQDSKIPSSSTQTRRNLATIYLKVCYK